MSLRYFLPFILISLFSCGNNKEIYVLFSNADGLKSNSPVYFDSTTIGQISDMKIVEGGDILVTLNISSDIEIPKAVNIHYQVDYLGNSYIEIVKSKGVYNNFNRALKSEKVNLDSSDFKELSSQQLDSLIQADPNGHLIDTVFTILHTITKNKKSTDSLDRTGIIIQ